jgi:hypothetical protein
MNTESITTSPRDNTLLRAVDAGNQIFNLKAERTRKGLFVTAYCAGVTLRSNRLELDRILDLFIDGAVLICGLDTDDMEQEADRLEADIRKFILDAQTQL